MYQNHFQAQQDFFLTQKTKEIVFRKKQLQLLKKVLKSNEEQLFDAVFKDFKKSKQEVYTTELLLIYTEIDEAIANLREWTAKKKVATNLLNFPSSNYILPQPLGVTLTISAWNYPLQLSFAPVIASIAAGNTVFLKPSELAPNTAIVIEKLITENFSKNYFIVVNGSVHETTELLKLPWNKVFFTGSTAVGKIVYQAAAQNLSPVTLELGGKSLVIITKNANLKRAAQRIAWGKFLNAGQTCVAPDYLYVEESIKEKFIILLKQKIQEYKYATKNGNYTQIINDKHFERILGLIHPEKVIFGGNYNKETRIIEPTILDHITWEDACMQEEIFGPVLPILSFTNLNEVVSLLQQKPSPLALYIFSDKKSEVSGVFECLSFGGGCVNDVVMHLVNGNYGFGGVGHSGIGAYHGYEGFKTFSHFKSILHRPNFIELPLRHSPYTSLKTKLINVFEKLNKYISI
jgi:aldehyde dehydrogenase (NAD+)